MGTTRRELLRLGTVALGGAALGLHAATKARAPIGKNKTMQTSTIDTKTTTPRAIERVLGATAEHWVGDGFRVRSVISPDGDPRVQSPFLLLDHAPRRYFEPAAQRRGVGEHPHRGFETVTFAYRGEIEHRDSTGGGGRIGAGDVQWMTAASGLVHEEFHSQRFTETGGDMEMVQLWVNLPASAKMSKPGYQPLLDADFPRLTLGAAEARLIAGALGKTKGPAHTHTPITIFDLAYAETGHAEFELPASHNVMVFTLEGQIAVGADARRVAPGHMAVLAHSDGVIRVRGETAARALVLSGEPIAEPLAAYGPFVMNTREELIQAVRDYQSGKMGSLSQ